MKPYKIPSHKGSFVLNGTDLKDLELELSDIERDFTVREVDIVFRGEKLIFNKLEHSRSAYQFVKEVIFDGLEVQEHFVVLYLNQSNRIIGYYHHSKGTINSTQVDVQLVMAVAIKTLAKGIVLSHNHPSGNTRPSEADRKLTSELKKAAAIFGIAVLDHIIATKDDYYSFADSNESSLKGTQSQDPLLEKLRARILEALAQVTQGNSPFVFGQIQTKAGYAKMEEHILKRMLRDNRIPEAIIPQIEMEWQIQ